MTPKLKIHRNSFTNWILQEEGKEKAVIDEFHKYTSSKITPKFNEDFSEIIFSIPSEYEKANMEVIKISRGEENNFIWSIFYTLIVGVIGELNIDKDSRSTEKFNDLKYIFIDDPVSSLDENNLIQQAVDLATLISSSDKKSKIKFIITTHNVLFYNVLYNELKLKEGLFLSRDELGNFNLCEKKGDSNKSFSYHIHIKNILEEAIDTEQVERFHFMLLRNLYEKTANFLGYSSWSEILPEDSRQNYIQRFINFSSHSTLSNEEIIELKPQEKNIVQFLLKHLIENYKFFGSKDESKNEK